MSSNARSRWRRVLNSGFVRSLHHGAGSERVRVIAPSAVTLQFYTYYYPGWRATVDGQLTEIRPQGPYGLITLELPAGDHDVEIRFTNTPLRTLAAMISVLTALLLGGLLVVRSRAQDD